MPEHQAHSLESARDIVDAVNDTLCEAATDGDYHETISEFWGIDYDDARMEAQRAAMLGIQLARDNGFPLPAAMVTVYFMGLYHGRAHAIPGLIEGIDPDVGLADLPDDVVIPDSLPEDD